MKSILLSIKPKWVAKILNGEKTIEIRKRFPANYVGWVYIYCTKDNKQRLYPVALLDKSNQVFKRAYREGKIDNRVNYLNGKVVARFWCDKVDDYVNGRKWSWKSGCPVWGACGDYEYILKDCCLTDDELRNYVDDLSFSAIYISKLEIFDKPKELKEFSNCDKYPYTKYIGKAPQNYCYVEGEKN